MKEAILLLMHLLTRLALLLKRSGTRTVLAESLLLKQQLLVLQRSRRRAPNLRMIDRLLLATLYRNCLMLVTDAEFPGLRQLLDVGIDRDDCSVTTDHVYGRNGTNMIGLLGIRADPHVVCSQPTFRLQVFVRRGLIFIHAGRDQDDRTAPVSILLRVGLQLGYLGLTETTPRRPEFQNDGFARVSRELLRVAGGQIKHFNARGFGSFGQQYAVTPGRQSFDLTPDEADDSRSGFIFSVRYDRKTNYRPLGTSNHANRLGQSSASNRHGLFFVLSDRENSVARVQIVSSGCRRVRKDPFDHDALPFGTEDDAGATLVLGVGSRTIKREMSAKHMKIVGKDFDRDIG